MKRSTDKIEVHMPVRRQRPKRACLYLLATIFASLLVSQHVNAVDYYVSTSGNDKNSGMSPKTPFLTLNHAIAQCNSNFDRIYVAPGRYAVTANRALSSSNAALEIIGDTTGKLMGEAGYPQIISAVGRWAVHLRDGSRVGFHGLVFTGDSGGNFYGVQVSGFRRGATFSDCRFQSLYSSTYTLDGHTSFENCVFQEIGHRNLHALRSSVTVTNSQFVNCRYAIFASESDVHVTQSSFTSDSEITRQAVYTTGSSFSAKSLTFSGYSTAIQAIDATGMLVDSCAIENIRSWGVYAAGRKLQISNVVIKNETRSGNGVCLRSTDGPRAEISNSTMHGVYAGVVSYGEECDYRNVRLENNRIGYYSVNAGSGSLRLQGNRELDIDNNYIGIYVVNPAGSPGNFDFRDVHVTNNDYGLYTINTSVRISRGSFQKNSRGLYIRQAPTATVESCDFIDNVTRNEWSHWGARIESAQIQISRCTFERNDSGLVIVNQSEKAPSLNDIKCNQNLNHGLTVIGGSLRLDNKMQILIDGSQYGLRTQDAECSIEQWSAPTGATYPFYHTRGSLVMSGCDVSEGVYGVVTVQTTSTSIDKCNFSNLNNYCLYDSRSQRFSVERCQFNKNNRLGIYAHESSRASITGCEFSTLTHSAIYAIRQSALVIQDCTIDGCQNSGIYCTAAEAPSDHAFFRNLAISNCRFGIRAIGIPIHEKNLLGATLSQNEQALRVERAELRLNGQMKLEAIGNRHAFLCYSGILSCESFSSKGNEIGLYSQNSQVNIYDTDLSCSQDGCLLYGSNVAAQKLTIQSGRYGFYFNPQQQVDCKLYVEDVTIVVSDQIGMYLIGRDGSGHSSIRNVDITGGRHGFYASGGDLTVQNLTTRNSQTYGVYVQNANSQMDEITVENCGNWSIYGNQGTMNVSNSRFLGGRGILLNTLSSDVTNCLVSGCSYGVYTNNIDGRYQVISSTLADIQLDGLRAQRGSLTVVNTIVQAVRFGMIATANGGIFSEHNLVLAGREKYRNTSPGANDIHKQPIFVSAPSRDYRLGSGSPAINAGKDLSAINPRDIIGNPRGSFGGHEIGAYEYMDKSGSLRIMDWRETAH